MTIVGAHMPYPIGLRAYEIGPPAPTTRALIVFCSFGDRPRPPLPSGKCTQARPRSNCAPRNSAAGVVFGSCSARSWSHSSVDALLVARDEGRHSGFPSHLTVWSSVRIRAASSPLRLRTRQFAKIPRCAGGRHSSSAPRAAAGAAAAAATWSSRRGRAALPLSGDERRLPQRPPRGRRRADRRRLRRPSRPPRRPSRPRPAPRSTPSTRCGRPRRWSRRSAR